MDVDDAKLLESGLRDVDMLTTTAQAEDVAEAQHTAEGVRVFKLLTDACLSTTPDVPMTESEESQRLEALAAFLQSRIVAAKSSSSSSSSSSSFQRFLHK